MKKLFSILIILVMICALSGCGGASTQSAWGSGITQGIPQFDHQPASYTADQEGTYAAAYYNNVSGDEIAAYLSTLAEQGIVIKSGVYPASAILEDKIITVHYNVTEMLFSVTVTKITK